MLKTILITLFLSLVSLNSFSAERLVASDNTATETVEYWILDNTL